ncbi:MAG: hypothetical protein ACKODH_02005 [Limisphaerales bacterium]
MGWCDLNHMMPFPPALRPTSTSALSLAKLVVVEVPTAHVEFFPWTGPPLADNYGGKAVLDYHGEPLFAELVILRHFESAGWNGVWVDTYRRRLRRSMEKAGVLPSGQRALLDRVAARAGSRYGCFDVFVWSGQRIAFAEAKRAGADRIRKNQVLWVAAALAEGVPLEALLIVEWTLARSSAVPHDGGAV